MGLSLFADDDDYDGPSADWSYGRFRDFQRRLAAAEGFALESMQGRPGGARAWDSVDSTLRPLLDRAEDHGYMSVDQCAQVLPRLTEIITRWKHDTPSDPALEEQITTGEQLVIVLTICVKNQVRLVFG